MSYALITGASKGIGKAIAFELAKQNYHLLLTARSAGLLQTVCTEIAAAFNVKVYFKALDLSEKDAPQKLYDWCTENNFAVSVLVNNAGYGLSGAVENVLPEENVNLIQLNITAPTLLCHLFIPLLKKQAKAYIMNIASTTAYQAVPFLTVYAASKAYIKNFSRGLSRELADTNISVTCISPGSTDTDWAITAKVPEKTLKLADKFNMTPEAVAKISVSAMLNKSTEKIPGAINKIGVLLAWLLPKKWVEKSAGKLYK